MMFMDYRCGRTRFRFKVSNPTNQLFLTVFCSNRLWYAALTDMDKIIKQNRAAPTLTTLVHGILFAWLRLLGFGRNDR
jgi:hypothetical protein